MASKTQTTLRRRLDRMSAFLDLFEAGDTSKELITAAKRELEYIKEITARMDLSVPDQRNGDEEKEASGRR